MYQKRTTKTTTKTRKYTTKRHKITIERHENDYSETKTNYKGKQKLLQTQTKWLQRDTVSLSVWVWSYGGEAGEATLHFCVLLSWPLLNTLPTVSGSLSAAVARRFDLNLLRGTHDFTSKKKKKNVTQEKCGVNRENFRSFGRQKRRTWTSYPV